jgi:arsenate reductase (thioredoxin)
MRNKGKLMKQNVLFLCTGNSCRSQMAEGYLRHLASDRFDAESAGTMPSQVNPLAIAAMKEKGIDISGHRSKNVTEFLGRHFTYVVTVCDNARQQCPIFPGNSIRLHWPLEDPADAAGTESERMVKFREIRDQIEQRIRELIAAKG